jgi:hypothetical protein
MSDNDCRGDETCLHDLILNVELRLGDNGWHAGTAVNSAGTVWPWLFSPQPGTPEGDYRLWPEHEMLGPLPHAFQDRLLPRRCGAPTKTGTPCKAEVSTPGQRCHHHQAATPKLGEAA